MPIKKASRDNSKLIVIDPREIDLTRYAHLWIRPVPGTESLIINTISKLIFDQNLESKDVNPNNIDEYKKFLWKFDARKVSSITKVPEEQIIEAARIISGSSKTSFTFGQDTVKDSESKDFVDSIINLASITNNLNGEGKGIYPTFNGIGTANFYDIFSKNKKSFSSIDNIIEKIKESKIKALIMFGDGINPDLITEEPFCLLYTSPSPRD